mgnify:CR=1 FL=1|jgi:hypothetical protein
MAKVTIEDLKGLLGAIEMAEGALEAGCEDPDTIAQINHASRCFGWVQAEIRRREDRQLIRRTLKQIREGRAAR